MRHFRVFSPLALVAGLLVALVAPNAAEAQQAYAYQNVFDDADGLTLAGSGMWGVDNTPAVANASPGSSGGNSLNYNDGVDYDNGASNTGTARTPTINLSGVQQPADATMSFWCRYQTETTGTSYDQRWVRFYNASTQALIYSVQLYQSGSGSNNCPSMSSWHQHTWTAMPAGTTGVPIFIEFYFNTQDSIGNAYQGWFIDDLVIITADTTPPALIADLAASDPTLSGCTLEWTSPTDDDLAGQAASFDLRYSPNPITDANFGTATQINGEPSPGAPGTLHTVNITNLAPGTLYHFAVTSTDPAGNTSLISNVATVTTVALPPVGGSATTALEAPKDRYTYCGVGLAGAPSTLFALGMLLTLAGAGRRYFRRR
jgi:hypothetical protein